MSNKITCMDVVLQLKKVKTLVPAKWLAKRLATSSRAVATALRTAVDDGRVYRSFTKGLAWYRFTRMTPRHRRLRLLADKSQYKTTKK